VESSTGGLVPFLPVLPLSIYILNSPEGGLVGVEYSKVSVILISGGETADRGGGRIPGQLRAAPGNAVIVAYYGFAACGQS